MNIMAEIFETRSCKSSFKSFIIGLNKTPNITNICRLQTRD